ncbi:MAG: hypothetical protein EZS28_018122 [Streblomastix strix]|uniref:Uncharacterized protein n=1 Tax=Streblomastix strix TaxID=222440 RepID=A0A5J4VUK2_9EUKA|nr:MAG: hypothetical protein EZS28_018122 [Streblomastix strix]
MTSQEVKQQEQLQMMKQGVKEMELVGRRIVGDYVNRSGYYYEFGINVIRFGVYSEEEVGMQIFVDFGECVEFNENIRGEVIDVQFL